MSCPVGATCGPSALDRAVQAGLVAYAVGWILLAILALAARPLRARLDEGLRRSLVRSAFVPAVPFALVGVARYLGLLFDLVGPELRPADSVALVVYPVSLLATYVLVVVQGIRLWKAARAPLTSRVSRSG